MNEHDNPDPTNVQRLALAFARGMIGECERFSNEFPDASDEMLTCVQAIYLSGIARASHMLAMGEGLFLPQHAEAGLAEVCRAWKLTRTMDPSVPAMVMG